jgi:Lrp/AsnC family transcriptional regulator for asnA, asnC and gidA
MPLLDDIDKKIIEILKNDSRTPFTEIASALGLSDSTIHVRLKKLRDEGIILRYTVDLNEDLIEKKVHGLIMINVNPGHLEAVIEKLRANHLITHIYEAHGDNDLIVTTNTKDLDELRELIIEIRQIPNIATTSLITILKIWK